MVTRVYTASSSCSTTMKKQQQEVVQYLECHNIDFEVVDITMSEEKRQRMYKNIPKSKWPEHGNPLPPQIYYDDTYCGDYNDFFEAKESNTVSSFLRIKSKSASRKEEM
ncbi:SH3 domain-binding glutamic acid-rich-like protein 2 isoform X1 [Rana temporaria]|uniref:SH3 domain-binding glutamic acid-rich-like protein 2 isoform X1 n=2 Tax=Rana temporaria TaxID=8407 RepID=UPI001AAD2234|nr:SH3 domain-binding glutamic acid-rich-like protein 2 isoform X1 [Rana temporaria]